MGIADQLDVIRSEFPDCGAIAFADLASGLVLCASTRTKMGQEQLDALCARAQSVLEGAASAPLAGALGTEATALREVCFYEGGRLTLIVRSPVEPDEALCCQCGPGIDLTGFLDRARSELASFGASH